MPTRILLRGKETKEEASVPLADVNMNQNDIEVNQGDIDTGLSVNKGCS